jgi:hypothetical protein
MGAEMTDLDVCIRGKWATREVWIAGVPLFPNRSQSVRNHSPDGFNWGYGGSGPGQLALALLLEFTNHVQFSLRHYQTFKFRYIAQLPQSDFTLPIVPVREYIRECWIDDIHIAHIHGSGYLEYTPTELSARIWSIRPDLPPMFGEPTARPGCGFCMGTASYMIERSQTPICEACVEVYKAGQSNPEGGLRPIENTDTEEEE